MNPSADQMLSLWHRVTCDSLKRGLPDLTARQMALLLQVYMAPPPHTVRGLAQSLGISKPAVTRALDRLGQLDFVRRKREEADRRSIQVQRTVKGSVFLRDLGDSAAAIARDLDRR